MTTPPMTLPLVGPVSTTSTSPRMAIGIVPTAQIATTAAIVQTATAAPTARIAPTAGAALTARIPRTAGIARTAVTVQI